MKKNLKLNKNQTILIEWDDTVSTDQSLESIRKPYISLGLTYNIGYFVSQDEKSIIITDMISPILNQKYHQIMIIPKDSIRRIKILNKGKEVYHKDGK